MKHVLFSTVFSLLFVSILYGQDFNELFQEGNIALGEQRLEDALASYEEALLLADSPNLRTNLSLAHARKAEIAAAAYHALRALQLDPSHEAAQANLMVLEPRLNLDSRLPEVPRIARWIPSGWWPILATVGFWSLLLGILLRFHPNARFPSLPLFAIAVIFIPTSVWAMLQLHQFRQWTLVATDEAILRLAPSPESPGESYLPAGSPVRLVGESGEFLLALTPSEQEGFLMGSEVFQK